MGYYEEKKERDNKLYTLLGTVRELDDKKLAHAYTLLFGNEWHKYWNDKTKADEMKSIFGGGTKPCCDFINWVECINYLNQHCA